MADSDRKIIRVSAESDKVIRDYAERRGLEFGDAADSLITTAVSRLNALRRYSKNNKEPQAPGKPRPKKSAGEKKKAAAAKKVARKANAQAAARARANGTGAHA